MDVQILVMWQVMANCSADTCTCARFVCCSHVLLLFPIARRHVSEVCIKCRKSFCLRWKWFLEDCVERFIEAFEVGVCVWYVEVIALGGLWAIWPDVVAKQNNGGIELGGGRWANNRIVYSERSLADNRSTNSVLHNRSTNSMLDNRSTNKSRESRQAAKRVMRRSTSLLLENY